MVSRYLTLSQQKPTSGPSGKRHVEAQSASLRRASSVRHQSRTGTDAGFSVVQKGLSDGVLVDEIGHQHDGAATSLKLLREPRVRRRESSNFLISMACGLTLDVCLGSDLHRYHVQRLWWKLSCLGGLATSSSSS
jgi:hypothetical protein